MKQTPLQEACRGLLAEAHVGSGKIICPPAFYPHIKAIHNALLTDRSHLQRDVAIETVWLNVYSHVMAKRMLDWESANSCPPHERAMEIFAQEASETATLATRDPYRILQGGDT